VIVSIDDMTIGDLPAVLRFDVEAREDSLRDEITRPWARVRVMRDDRGEPLGYVVYWHVLDEIHVINVVVAAQHRRRGIGRRLLDDVFTYARASGVQRVLLEVRESNAAALALYEALGFVCFNIRRAYYADGEDALEMERRIAPAGG
jgi:[ribosomal protein S18]-alanine N-acetyltransferase